MHYYFIVLLCVIFTGTLYNLWKTYHDDLILEEINQRLKSHYEVRCNISQWNVLENFEEPFRDISNRTQNLEGGCSSINISNILNENLKYPDQELKSILHRVTKPSPKLVTWTNNKNLAPFKLSQKGNLGYDDDTCTFQIQEITTAKTKIISNNCIFYLKFNPSSKYQNILIFNLPEFSSNIYHSMILLNIPNCLLAVNRHFNRIYNQHSPLPILLLTSSSSLESSSLRYLVAILQYLPFERMKVLHTSQLISYYNIINQYNTTSSTKKKHQIFFKFHRLFRLKGLEYNFPFNPHSFSTTIKISSPRLQLANSVKQKVLGPLLSYKTPPPFLLLVLRFPNRMLLDAKSQSLYPILKALCELSVPFKVIDFGRVSIEDQIRYSSQAGLMVSNNG